MPNVQWPMMQETFRVTAITKMELKNQCFHVHTYRCGHAENIPDEEYIKKAIELGASGIWFSDHAPFPGNPFRNRMRYSELNEYLITLASLKERYSGTIDVHVGLEIEYFPSFDKSGYYKELRSTSGIEFLLLGQHMAETSEGYTFSWDRERLLQEEYKALGNAEVQGILSGYFDYVAHPDRIFRRQKEWTQDMQAISKDIIKAAIKVGIPLEQNEASKKRKRNYWNEFWELADETKIIHGLDAHHLSEMKIIY